MPPSTPPDAATPLGAAAATARSRMRRLPGRMPFLRLSPTERWSAKGGSARLWLSDGYLIQTRTWYYQETLERFAFGDIQAIQVRQTSRGLVYSIVLAAIALPLICACALARGREARIGLGIAAAVFFALLVVNVLRGATCRTLLTTALGTQLLLSLNRLRPTRRTLAILSERIESAQGTLTPEVAVREVDIRQSRYQT